MPKHAGRTAGLRKHFGIEDAAPQVHVLSSQPSTSMEHLIPSSSRNIPSGLSINWHAPPSSKWNLASQHPIQRGTAEATLAASGRKAGVHSPVLLIYDTCKARPCSDCFAGLEGHF